MNTPNGLFSKEELAEIRKWLPKGTNKVIGEVLMLSVQQVSRVLHGKSKNMVILKMADEIRRKKMAEVAGLKKSISNGTPTQPLNEKGIADCPNGQ